MAEIDTGINIDVPIKSYSDTPAVSVGRKTAQRDVGADALAKALKDISPVFEKWVTAKEKEKATASTLEGANAINGITLEEARELHKAGFPDIQNPWARYGAYKQYAANSADKLLFDFQKEYKNNYGNKDYNWETAWAAKTNNYLSGKDDDVYFQNAYNDTNIALRKWVNKQELEKQSAELTLRVKTDTRYNIENIGDKVHTKLEVDFSENFALPHDFDDTSYFKAQSEFFDENFQKYWDAEYALIRENLNPAISKADLDGLVLDAAEYHIVVDGRYAKQYAKMLTEKRPDGTPPIFTISKYNNRVSKFLKDAAVVNKTMEFGKNFMKGNTAFIEQSEYNKESSAFILQRAAYYKSQDKSLDDNQAIGMALLEMMPALKLNNRPVPYVKQMLNNPIGTSVTRDNRLAFQTAILLDANGMLGQYFPEGNQNSVFWSIAINKFKTGGGDAASVDQIIKEIGQLQGNFMKNQYSQLTSQDKNRFADTTFSNLTLTHPRNRAIIWTMGEYFKNVAGEEWETELKNWVDTNYEIYNEKLYSKNTLQEMNINADQFDHAKEVVAGILIEHLKINKDNIVDHDLDALMEGMDIKSRADIPEVSKTISGVEIKGRGFGEGTDIADEQTQFNIDDYELILNPEEGTLSLAVKTGDVGYMLPSTFETKDGKRAFLTVPVNIFSAKLAELSLEQQKKALEKMQKKDDKKRKKDKKMKKLEDMGVGVETFGQGEIYKF